MRRSTFVVAVAFISGAVLHGGRAYAQNATTPGAITLPYPTSQAIAIEWAITGDANNNGVVTVRYRPNGATAWKTGMALVRVPAGSNTTGTFGTGGSWSNKHAGSLFDLAPGQLYDIELTLTDPDGGSMTMMTSAGTRVIPGASANAPVKAVTPANLTSMLSAAMPGDILLLGAGSYPAFTVSKNGTAGQQIVIRGESVDTVTIGGRVTMNDRQYVSLENMTVMGEVRMNGASNMVVRGCRIRTTAGGITFEMGSGIPRNNTIVDNDIVGGAMWIDSMLSADGYDGGEGIQFTGSGHVICFNHVALFRDNISFMEYDEAFEQTSIDICNNDIEQATDDAIEADSAMGNVRVFRNRIRNCFDGISAQPNLGGPTYYFRNALYNVLYTAFKFHNGTVGDVVVNNTAVKCGDALGIYAGETWKRALFRNNVFIGGMGGGTYGGYDNGTGRIFEVRDADTSCSFDYDGLASIGTNTFAGHIGATAFTSFATLTANTTEKNAVMVDLGIFATPPAFPANPYPPKSIADLRLAAGSAAIDKGVVIVGLNDDFAAARRISAPTSSGRRCRPTARAWAASAQGRAAAAARQAAVDRRARVAVGRPAPVVRADRRRPARPDGGDRPRPAPVVRAERRRPARPGGVDRPRPAAVARAERRRPARAARPERRRPERAERRPPVSPAPADLRPRVRPARRPAAPAVPRARADRRRPAQRVRSARRAAVPAVAGARSRECALVHSDGRRYSRWPRSRPAAVATAHLINHSREARTCGAASYIARSAVCGRAKREALPQEKVAIFQTIALFKFVIAPAATGRRAGATVSAGVI